MKKFVYRLTPNGKDLFIKAETLKSAKLQLKKTFGGHPYYIGETAFKTTIIKAVAPTTFTNFHF